ncbi:sigma-54-dependent Fis family transcriptional regulator [Paracoccus zhejiangensis]|uniref:Sigma-54-dependent Fis family transcriptional regulator n=1 Tax=Paracoccus zhejiangensis TaxID=1077935 RepID=A0A2H5EYN5_9RHOB|nr:sigma-54-dependent Fis family transcriptional regulator [Paracoccus zhejiangensis]AUH64412.1 sigma-54-dependent Fis family transcriptional regulator [Paracoccus zhejiangensis]
MSDKVHIEEIEHALRGRATGRDDLVSESWRRCVELYGLDPARRDPAHIVTDTELREHREQSERLIATARSGLQSLFRQVAGQNYVLLLSDAKGVCVDYFGDPQFEDELRGSGLFLGSDWAEDRAGTSAVGACLYTGQPLTIHQTDHFGIAHTPLSCTAAPIFDSLGKLTAVLDISLLRSPGPKSSQRLAMTLVTSSARRVELANLMAESRREWVLRLAERPEFLDVDPEAAITLDGSGRIVGFTGGAAAMLAEGGAGALLGQSIDSYLDLSVDELPDLMRDRPTEQRLIRTRNGGALFGHAIAPQNPRVGRAAPAATRRGGALADLAGADPAMDALLGQAERLAPTDIPLVLAGETGTGKARLARAIHTIGRPGARLLVEDCARLDIARLEAAMAGGEGRAGTLLLRGLDDLPQDQQPQLSALLDAHPEWRIVTSARRDLAGLLRPDLLYRVSGAVLAVPPLRQRRDFDWLVDRLLRRRMSDDPRLSPAARAELAGRNWPGNIRELERVLDVAVALAGSPVIDLTDLPPPLAAPVAADEAPDDELERVLEACGWNMSKAARRLGVNRSTILRRMRKAGIAVPQ